MKRRGIFMVVALFLIAAACGGDEPTPTPSGTGAAPTEFSLATASAPYKGTTIRILDELSDLQPTFAEVIPQFEQATGIEVNYEIKNHFDVITIGEADLFSGRGAYDAIMLHRFQWPNAFEGEVIQFLDPYINDAKLHDPSVTPGSFIDINQQGTTWGNNQVCYMNWPYNEVWIGRKDLMENADEQAAFKAKYGYDLAPPETLQQMRDIAAFFTRKAGDKLAGTTLSDPFYGFIQEGTRLGTTWNDVMLTFVHAFGGALYDDAGTPTANRPENVAGLEFWKSLFASAPPGASEVSLVDIPTIVGGGQVASGIGFSDFFFSMDAPGGSSLAGKFVYAPVPVNADNASAGAGPVTPSCLMINQASKQKEATYLFLQWIVTQETQDAYLKQSVQKGGFDPVLKSSLQNADFTSSQRANLNASIATSLERAHFTPIVKGFTKAIDAMLVRFQEFLLGRKTAQQALDALQADMTKECASNCALQPPG